MWLIATTSELIFKLVLLNTDYIVLGTLPTINRRKLVLHFSATPSFNIYDLIWGELEQAPKAVTLSICQFVCTLP